ncbi:BTB/POZ domain-containing protein 2-like [Venturia canescens]|uniref:BTB/POZ domain-containing protein 2-like n=1 Tax=Venturia canescens TaxID=32260 RepID=UPI001C9D2AE4|nr:BTB/POZ domain-containing protein 2-like [Venturia canescens]
MCSPVNWQLNKKGLSARGRYLLQNRRWTDCEFLVGEPPNQELIKAHTIYLAASSPVFEKMFFECSLEENNPIRIPEVKKETFKTMLEYIYVDELEFDCFESTRDLYYCAKKYMLFDLAERCSVFIQTIVSSQQVCAIYEFAELFEDKKLADKCINLICLETKKILTGPSWISAPKVTVSILFDQEMLKIDSEEDLYVALLVWSKAECERKSLPTDQKNLRTVSEDLVTKIRFLTFTPEKFIKGPGRAEILNKDEVLAIIMNIISPNSVPMPLGFSIGKVRTSTNYPLHQPPPQLPADEPLDFSEDEGYARKGCYDNRHSKKRTSVSRHHRESSSQL